LTTAIFCGGLVSGRLIRLFVERRSAPLLVLYVFLEFALVPIGVGFSGSRNSAPPRRRRRARPDRGQHGEGPAADLRKGRIIASRRPGDRVVVILVAIRSLSLYSYI